MKNENVLVIPKQKIDIFFEQKRSFTDVLEFIDLNQEFKFRPEVEKDTSYKQIIPYVVVKRNGLVLSYQRAGKGHEERLKAFRSIGIGGHVKDTDQYFLKGLEREVKEELGINLWHGYLKYVGIIDLNKEEVDKVHLGILFTLDLTRFNGEIEPDQEEIISPMFTTLENIENIFALETWSLEAIKQIRKEAN